MGEETGVEKIGVEQAVTVNRIKAQISKLTGDFIEFCPPK
jgi:hypothetical protein